MFAWVDILYMAGGGALVWFYKDTFLKWWQGAQTFANNMKAKAAAIEAQAQTTVNAVKNSVK